MCRLLVLTLIVMGSSLGQPLTASNWIDVLASPDGQERSQLGLFSCGVDPRTKEAYSALVSLGGTALPDIERTLDSIEAAGEASVFSINAGLLLAAYVEIRGETAWLRLDSMSHNPQLEFLKYGLDHALAISKSLTSFVSQGRAPGRIFHCDRPEAPTDALDRLIASWRAGDREDVGLVLAPHASSAIMGLLSSAAAWSRFHASLRTGSSGGIGYRLSPGDKFGKDPPSGVFMVQFSDAGGGDCGAFRVAFEKELGMPYRVDSTDVDGLMRLIAECAGRP